MAKKPLNIALVGYGFMGKTHSHAFLQAPRFFEVPYQPVLKAVVARNADRVRKFADTWGYQSAETDWRAMVDRKDIDLIDIASPNDTHAEIAVAAARAGKMVMCEKPLGRTAVEAEKMVSAVESARVPNSVWYNYRRLPAVTLLKHLIDEGSAFLGRFQNGSLALFEATRYARGHKALYTLEINGEHASARWDLHDLHRLQWFDHRDEGRLRGWRSVHITDGDHPYMKQWWVPGLQIGYEHTFIHQFADFLEAAAHGRSLSPTFRDGLATDYLTDAGWNWPRTAAGRTSAWARQRGDHERLPHFS